MQFCFFLVLLILLFYTCEAAALGDIGRTLDEFLKVLAECLNKIRAAYQHLMETGKDTLQHIFRKISSPA